MNGNDDRWMKFVNIDYDPAEGKSFYNYEQTESATAIDTITSRGSHRQWLGSNRGGIGYGFTTSIPNTLEGCARACDEVIHCKAFSFFNALQEEIDEANEVINNSPSVYPKKDKDKYINKFYKKRNNSILTICYLSRQLKTNTNVAGGEYYKKIRKSRNIGQVVPANTTTTISVAKTSPISANTAGTISDEGIVDIADITDFRDVAAPQ